MHDIFIVSSIVSDLIVNFSLAITAIVLWKQSPLKWRLLSIYLILLPLFVITKYLMWPLFHIGNRFIDNLLINPTEMVCTLLFFFLSLNDRKLKSTIIWMGMIYFAAYFVDVFFYIDLNNEHPENLIGFYNLLVVILCLLGFRQLLNQAEHIKIIKYPQFWFYTALLVLNLSSIVINYTHNLWSYLENQKVYYIVYYLIYIVHALFLFIGYFYIFKNSKHLIHYE